MTGPREHISGAPWLLLPGVREAWSVPRRRRAALACCLGENSVSAEIGRKPPAIQAADLWASLGSTTHFIHVVTYGRRRGWSPPSVFCFMSHSWASSQIPVVVDRRSYGIAFSSNWWFFILFIEIRWLVPSHVCAAHPLGTEADGDIGWEGRAGCLG